MSICPLALIFTLLFSFGLSAQSHLPPLMTETEGKIWANIPFFKAGNLHEFQAEMSRTREQARNRLLIEQGGILIPVVMTPHDLRRISLVLARIIQDFDLLVRRHERSVHEGIPKSIQEILKSSYDSLFDYHRIPFELQRGRFTTTSADSSELVKNVRFYAYGTYSVIAGGKIEATLTLEELVTGRVQHFLAKGTVKQASQGLAQKLFDFFQSNKYPDWINPQPQLEWMAPISPDQTVLATVARRYCEGQGARLPYAEELIQASLGGNYRTGGIVLKKNSYYVIADRQRNVDQYYYNTHPWGETQTGGPVQTSAGIGTVQGRVWCVKGLPGKNIRLVEGIYRLLREAKDTMVVGALEFILVHLQDFGMRTWSAGNYRSVEEAVSVLEEKGILIEVPVY